MRCRCVGRCVVAQGGQGPQALCRRWCLARAGRLSHGADRLSAACDAWLYAAGARSAGILRTRAACRSGNAVADRSRFCRTPSAAWLCGCCSRPVDPTQVKPESIVISALGVREGSAVLAIEREEEEERPADRCGAQSQRLAFAFAAAWRGDWWPGPISSWIHRASTRR